MDREVRQGSNWSYSVGKRGYRVRVYEQRQGSPLSISYWVPGSAASYGHAKRIGLGHRDRDRAVREANAMSRKLCAENAYLWVPLGEIFVGFVAAGGSTGKGHATISEVVAAAQLVEVLGAHRTPASIVYGSDKIPEEKRECFGWLMDWVRAQPSEVWQRQVTGLSLEGEPGEGVPLDR